MSCCQHDVAVALKRTTYLELADPLGIIPGRPPVAGVALNRIDPPWPELSRFYYTAIGGRWHWTDRLGWDWPTWQQHLSSPDRESWSLTVDSLPAGWCELSVGPDGSVEIGYFGLIDRFTGRGLGGWFLESMLRRGFERGRRVWVHTCSLDGPAALANYQARGMVTFRVDEAEVAVAPEPPGPWPGASRPWGET